MIYSFNLEKTGSTPIQENSNHKIIKKINKQLGILKERLLNRASTCKTKNNIG